LLGLGIGILFHRMVLKGHRLFDWGSNKGCLRPMPLDCMLFFLTFFNIRKITNENRDSDDDTDGEELVFS
jgi:hypothetical protein